jgi:hypothetical protein
MKASLRAEVVLGETVPCHRLNIDAIIHICSPRCPRCWGLMKTVTPCYRVLSEKREAPEHGGAFTRETFPRATKEGDGPSETARHLGSNAPLLSRWELEHLMMKRTTCSSTAVGGMCIPRLGQSQSRWKIRAGG